MQKQSATLIGFVAIATWAFLALLSTLAGPIPPFQLAAMTFLLGGLTGAASWIVRPAAIKSLRQPWPVGVGAAGLCIYHCLYFFAIQSAPPIEVSSDRLPLAAADCSIRRLPAGRTLARPPRHRCDYGVCWRYRNHHQGRRHRLDRRRQARPRSRLACAFVWSGYSVLSRRFGKVSTDVVAGYCLITAAVAFLLHMAFETTVWPQTPTQWSAIVF